MVIWNENFKSSQPLHHAMTERSVTLQHRPISLPKISQALT